MNKFRLNQTFLASKTAFMGTVYLHIGVFKTGSSTLQAFFAQNVEKLKSLGITYPIVGSVASAKVGLITAGNASSLAHALLPGDHKANKPDQRQSQLEWFEETLKTAQTPDILLSSEFLCDLDAGAFATLNAIAKKTGRALKVVAWVREQASYVESIYIQHVKRRRITDMPAPYIKALFPTLQHLNYHTFLSALSETLGQENVSVLEYGKADVIRTILDILGLEDKGFDYPSKKINVSLPYFLVPIFLELNKLDPNMSFSDQVVRNQAQLQLHETPERRSLLAPELRTEIRQYFEAENKALSKAFFGGAKIFEATPPEYISIEEASRELDAIAVTKLLGGIAIQHERRLVRVERAILALGKKLDFEPNWVRKISTN